VRFAYANRSKESSKAGRQRRRRPREMADFINEEDITLLRRVGMEGIETISGKPQAIVSRQHIVG